MIFSFTTRGRDCIAAMTVGLTVAQGNGAERGESYRSAFRLMCAAMPPNRGSLPAPVLGTCRGWLSNESAPGLFNSLTVTTTRRSV